MPDPSAPDARAPVPIPKAAPEALPAAARVPDSSAPDDRAPVPVPEAAPEALPAAAMPAAARVPEAASALEAEVAPLLAGREAALEVALEAALEAAAWWGAPADALALLDGLHPDDPVPERTRWLAGVCLGALGRYRAAARWLDVPPVGSSAASCRASHLRQVGRHAEAEPLDRYALAAATDPESAADALVGLVADAIGRHDPAAARDRLVRARDQVPTTGDAAWRGAVRLGWVGAELALLTDDPREAVRLARAAEHRSRDLGACRHAVKSRLVLGVSLEAAGLTRPAARVLRAAAAGAGRLELSPLQVVACTLRAGTLQVRAPRTAARERRRAGSAQSLIEDPASGRTYG